MAYCDKKFVAEKIKLARKKAKLNQAELAEKIGLSEKHLSKIETAKNYPSLDTFLKITEVLNLTLEDFGVHIQKENSEAAEKIHKIILTSSDDELHTYAGIIELVRNALRK